MIRAHARGETVNKSRLCVLTGRSRFQIDRWVIEGCPAAEAPKNKSGEWKFNTAQVFDWLDHRAETEDEAIDLNTERARLAKEQADNQALRNAVLRGDLMPAEEVESGWQAAIGRSRALLLGIPTSTASQIVLLAKQHEDADVAERAVRGLLVRMIDGALAELTNTSDSDDEEVDALGDPPVAA